jgi:hypothetical protein
VSTGSGITTTNDREKLPEGLGRDVSQQSAHVSHERATPEHVEKVYSQAEHKRHWAPLNHAVTAKEAEQFAWRVETGTIES